MAASPLAANAGYDILKRGGTAADAAVAVQFVLGLVEPQSSGLGGGAFLLHFSAADGRVRSYDGRETAPAAATGDRFLGPDGMPRGFIDALLSARSIGVPGAVAMLELAHRRHGRLPWATLAGPAIRLAEEGFELSPRLHSQLAADPYLARDAAARDYFYLPDGQPKPIGMVLRNPAYAATLRAIAAGGAAAFYRGEIARDVVAAARAGTEPGDMTEGDLAAYRSLEREPVCGRIRAVRLCGMPPPSAGGIAVLQMLGILERLPVTDYAKDPLAAVHRFAEAGRLAYADRDRYVADPAFVAVPVAGLLSPEYLAARAALVASDRSMGRAAAGQPPGSASLARGDAVAFEEAGTTHFSIVDADGNAVAVTSSIEFAFGSHRMVRGFLLNNQLTDFAPYPEDAGRPVANRVEGGKRPRSSMAPTLVFDREGRLLIVTGSPGGHAIINYVARMLVAVLDWNLPLQSALELPNFGSRNGPTDLEAGTAAAGLADPLRAMGHGVRVIDMTSGVHAILRDGSGWLGAADPRREGAARGE